MEPRIVEQAEMPPGQCLFSQDADGPWIDTGIYAPWVKPYGYLGVRYVEGLARDLLGMVPAKQVRGLEKQLEEIRERFAEVQQFIDATVEYEEIQAKERA